MISRTIYPYILLLTLAIATGMQAQSVDELRRKQQALEKEMATTSKMLGETKRSETATSNKLQLIGRNIKTQRKLINSIGQEIHALDQQMGELTARRDQLQTQLEQYKEDYALMVRESHYARIQQSPLLFILSSNSFVELSRRMRYMEEFSAYRRHQVEKITHTQSEIDEQNRMLGENRQEKQTSLQRKQREQENLARDERKQKKMLSELKKKEKDLKGQQKAQQKRANEINRQIEAIIRAQASKDKEKGQLTKEQQLISGGFAKNQGRLPWPIAEGHISRHFGMQQNEEHQYVTNNNKGTYFQTTRGAKARAVYEGTVSATIMLGSEYAVIVQHGTYRTVYSGLSALSVKQGDNVSTKQTLGTIKTDAADDNKTELYFQIYEGKNLLNPESWISR